MTRLAWFTPVPPEHSGIAAYNAELLPLLGDTYAIDAFIEDLRRKPKRFRSKHLHSSNPNLKEVQGIQLFDAHDFFWKHQRNPYDLIVYQLGNATCHDYMWPYLIRWPGLVVLHDGQLHHARARALLKKKRAMDYRAEFTYNHPDATPDIAKFGIAGLLGSLNYFWPMIRLVIESSKLVAVHNERLALDLHEQFPSVPVETITMGIADEFSDQRFEQTNNTPEFSNTKSKEIRRHHKISDESVVFAAFGKVTPEKRISQALGAVAALQRTIPTIQLFLVGDTVDYYDVLAEAKTLGISNRVTITGYVADELLPLYIATADVCLCQRWPSSGETSASWLRCLSAAKPTIITDLIHTVDTPALDPRSWNVNYGYQKPTKNKADRTKRPSSNHQSLDLSLETTLNKQPPDPICVGIDILDEEHSLKLAVQRLATDKKLRNQLGRNARTHWKTNHTLKHMVSHYQRVIKKALEVENPTKNKKIKTDLPSHLLSDNTEYGKKILQEFGLSTDLFDKSLLD